MKILRQSIKTMVIQPDWQMDLYHLGTSTCIRTMPDNNERRNEKRTLLQYLMPDI